MKKKICILIGIIVSGIVILFSCENNDTPGLDANIPELRSLSAGEQEIISSSNDFSFNILSKVNEAHVDKNIFISPFSISTALSMTLNGAEGETLEKMKETLGHSSMSNEEINEAYKDLVSYLLSLDKKVNLQVANSNWYRQEYNIKTPFKDVLHEYYQAEVNAIDFNSADAVDKINSWIENRTSGKIKDMLDQIPHDAMMYLINAIYFKADWQYQFEKGQTEDRDFRLANGSTVKVPTMYSKGVKVNYSQKEGVQFIEIPYGNGQFNFTVLMPDDPAENINEIINSLNSETLNNFIKDTTTFTTELYLPKINIEFKEELSKILSDMGMGIAFTGDADFNNLFQEELNLYISRVLHQSYLEVNEEGSEAAAATIVEIREYSSVNRPQTIKIDRPFAFFIREKHTNTVLFAGKVMNPVN